MELKQKRVFIVEDNTLNRVIYTVILKKHGAVIEFDRSGRSTIHRLRDFDPDLIILDLMLPHGDSGYSIFDEIRADPRCAAIPVVAVSASEPAVAIPKCQEQGFTGYIAKPINEALFASQLERILDGEAIWDAGHHRV